jgi:hypothetical protein
VSKKTSSAANSFGSGKDLIGMTCKGSKVVDASRQYMQLENGQTVERAGNRVGHDVITGSSNPDNGHYETDDL